MKKRYILAIIVILVTSCTIHAFEDRDSRQNLQVTYFDDAGNVVREARYYSEQKARELQCVKKISYYGLNGDITHVATYFTPEKSSQIGDYMHISFFDRKGRTVRIEKHHNQEKTHKEQVIKTVLYLN
ncbi:MAG: hypothetical protein ABIK68_08765, partial [bacterium]